MEGKLGRVNPAAGDESSNRMTMMDKWQESIERAQKNRQTPTRVAKDPEEGQAELERKIRSGQMPCPTCAARTYKDDSDDGGVSFQAPKHIPASNAGTAVMNHEAEHVSSEHKRAEKQEGKVVSGSVSLQYAKCPECGRTYVAGGVTKTTVEKPVRKLLPTLTGLDVEA